MQQKFSQHTRAKSMKQSLSARNSPEASFQSTLYLVRNLPHAFDGRVSALFVDAAQSNAFHAVVGAYFLARRRYFLAEAVVKDEIYFRIHVAFQQAVQHASHGGAEGTQVLPRPVGILEIAYGRASPAVVGGAEHENDIGAAQVRQPGHEGAVAVVAMAVAMKRYGGPRKRIVDAQAVTIFLDKHVPPGLRCRSDVGYCRVGPCKIEDAVRIGRQIALKGGIRITEYGHALGTQGLVPTPLLRSEAGAGHTHRLHRGGQKQRQQGCPHAFDSLCKRKTAF
jgi:hypothetical protein